MRHPLSAPHPPKALTLSLALAFLALVMGCAGDAADRAGSGDPAEAVSAGAPSPLASRCAPDDDGLSLPEGFCAILAAEETGPARHIEVRPDGDVFVAIRNRRSREGGATPGHVLALRDTDGDGTLDQREEWGHTGGTGILFDGETLYFAPDDAVLRYTVPAGSLTPTSGPDTVVHGLPADRSHAAKSLALGEHGGTLYVNIGAPSNACMEQSRTAGSPGMDPCPELETRGGIWRFDADGTGQAQADGTLFATGLRNVVALATHPGTGQLYGAQHGRDQLHDLFPDMYTQEQSAELPSEELVAIDDGDDFGWPYCYHDWQQGVKVLAPEYGGDGREVGRCAEAEDPLVAFPGHWAPNDLTFYTGDQFPGRYRDGGFVAFHGSWNRAPLPQEGYNVVFVPFTDGRPTGEWEVFADGFRTEGEGGDGDTAGTGAATGRGSARPMGVAQGPDGSLYVVDSLRGRIWRIVWRGGA